VKRSIIIYAMIGLVVSGTSMNARENEPAKPKEIDSIVVQGNGDSSRINESNITVEISDESAVIIDGQRYTLAEIIEKSIELNPDINIVRYNAAMSDTDRMKFDSKYSLYLNAEAGVSSAKYPEFLYSENGKQNDSVSVSTSVARSFSTGTTVAAGIGRTKTKLDSGMGQEYDITNPAVFASIEQELLKNAFGYNDRKQVKILDNAAKMQRDAYIYSISLVTFGVIVDYWKVVIAQNRLDNSRMMLAETKRVRRIVSEKVNIGLSEKFEINYWNSLVASSNASVKQAEQNYRNAMRQLLRDINMDRKITMQEKVVLSDKLPVINHEEALKRAFAKRADYLNAERALENAKLSIRINENNALPSLKGSVSVSSMDYNTDSAGDAYSNTKEMKYPAYEAKISMTYPLDDTGLKADERNAAWGVEQSKQNLEKARRYVRDDVTTRIENIGTNHQLYTEAKEARKQAELYYRSMVSNLKMGRFAASSVRDALDALVSCKEMELQLLVAYNASLIEFEVSKNELFETYGIDINKYIPEAK
jgi:outer membrane protein TolC